jgi:pyridoxamine 5'-phosphate oxidase
MDLLQEAIDRFTATLQQAKSAAIEEPTAMTVATVGTDGRPSARTVLLKDVDRRGFVFYTNLRSRKARQLAVNPRAALTFYWQPMREQVLVEGRVEPVADAEADAYWRTRPRLSQIGAWASLQSEPLDARGTLEARLAACEAEYAGREVPRPPHWSGYRVAPDLIEFWSARPGRLHDRVRYAVMDGDWRRSLIYP